MKKTLCLFLLATAMVACNPPTGQGTDGDAKQPADSAATVENPPHDSMPVTAAADSTPTKVDEGTLPTPGGGGGRRANPNLDLNAKRYVVTGHVTIAGSYCGGAAPTPEMEAEARKAKPYAQQPLLVRSGKANALGTDMVTRVTTDADGDFKLDLPVGTYCMVLAEKENARDPGFYSLKHMGVDKPCDNKWLNTCDLSFTVTDQNVSGLRLMLHKKCFIESLSPCVSYDGPMPPSAAPRGK